MQTTLRKAGDRIVHGKIDAILRTDADVHRAPGVTVFTQPGASHGIPACVRCPCGLADMAVTACGNAIGRGDWCCISAHWSPELMAGSAAG